MAADFIVIVSNRPGSRIRFTREVRLWNPQLYFLNYVSLCLNCSIIIKPANLLLELK